MKKVIEYSLECFDIHKFYQTGSTQLHVLKGINFNLVPGDIGIVMGPSGCGKTTLLTIVGGILPPSEGSCKVFGKALYEMSSQEKINYRAANIGFVFQQLNLFPSLSAVENAAIPLIIDSIPRQEAIDRASELMCDLGLEMHINSELEVLSGGQKQRLALARALIREPGLIICDEPTNNLDHDSIDLIFQIITKYAKSKKCAFFISTHDQRVVTHASKILKLNDGKNIDEGNTIKDSHFSGY